MAAAQREDQVKGSMEVTFQPSNTRTEVPEGTTILEAARHAEVMIESLCGGRGSCGKCRVVCTGVLSPLTDQERERLTIAEMARGHRLACQAQILGSVVIEIPAESRLTGISILSAGVDRPLSLSPLVWKVCLKTPAATLDIQVPDIDSIRQALRPSEDRLPVPTLGALSALSALMRESDRPITLVTDGDRILDVEAGDTSSRLYGMAFDIGTTTVVGYLVDLTTGETISSSSLLNPQTKYGDDVVSRIDLASHDRQGLSTLQRDIIKALNTIIETSTSESGVDRREVYAVTVVGNTTMHHLLLGINPRGLGLAPYVPVVVDPLRFEAAELGIRINPQGLTYVLPNIAGYLGADTVGVVLATDMLHRSDVALAVDIGTNGEMVLGHGDRLIACSTAAGPAFEGAHLSSGMRAAEGAIDAVVLDDDVHAHTIGVSGARGLCGSGLVDAISELVRVGILDPSGRMQSSDAARAFAGPSLAGRIRDTELGREFVLVRQAESATGRPVLITQRDVREVQLGKAAIRTGIQILMKELGVDPEDVKEVFLAGAFGNYIRLESALAIGLIPRFPNAALTPVGNAAGSGARFALLSEQMRADAVEIQRRVEYVELFVRADFQEELVNAMVFPAP